MASNPQKEVPRKRKIQPIFLGALGSTSSSGMAPEQEQQPSGCSAAKKQSTLGMNWQLQASASAAWSQMRANESVLLQRAGTGSGPGGGRKEVEGAGGNGRCPPPPPSSHNVKEEEGDGIEVMETGHSLNDKIRFMPKLRAEGGARDEQTVRPFPNAVSHQNVAKTGLPAPQMQNALAQSIPMDPNCPVDQILVKNALNSKSGVKYAKIQAKLGTELKWAQTITSPMMLMRANSDWLVSTHENNDLVVFYARTGKICFCLHTDSPLAILELSGHICMGLGTEAGLWTWDLRKGIRLLQTSIRTLLAGCPSPSAGKMPVVRASLSPKGVPLLTLSNGDLFVFSRPLHSWHSLRLSRAFLLAQLPTLQFIAKSYPKGLLASLLLNDDLLPNAANFGLLIPQSNVEVGGGMDPASEESQLEMLLRTASELEAEGEFRLLAAIYLQNLVKNGKIDKMDEFLDELRANSNRPVHAETVLADLRPMLEQNGLPLQGLAGGGQASREEEEERKKKLDTGRGVALLPSS